MKQRGWTVKRYSVSFVSIDPCFPIILTHTNDLKRAQRVFADIKKTLLDDQKENGPDTSEWTLTLFEHPEDGCWAIAHYHDEGFTYWVEYPTSKEIQSFTYMDLIREDDSENVQA